MRSRDRRSRITTAIVAGSLMLGIVASGAGTAFAEDTETGIDWSAYIGDGRGPRVAEMAAEAPRPQVMAMSGIDRLSGPDRYATAVDISKQNFAAGVDLAFIANGAAFPDALSGAPIAGFTASPILLVPGTSIPAVVQDELLRLQPQYIIILGGTGGVSDEVATQLQAFALSGTVERLAGSNRFETSAAISRAVFDGVQPQTVYIANGMIFPDALAAGPAAGVEAAPMLLVQHGSIPAVIAQELARLQPEAIIVMGGTGTVSEQVARQLAQYAPHVVRVSGNDRFGTAVDLSSRFWFDIDTPTVFIANGMQFPDALTIAPVAAMLDAPILLVTATSVPEVVRQELIARQPQRIVIVGGEGTVSAAVATELAAYVVP